MRSVFSRLVLSESSSFDFQERVEQPTEPINRRLTDHYVVRQHPEPGNQQDGDPDLDVPGELRTDGRWRPLQHLDDTVKDHGDEHDRSQVRGDHRWGVPTRAATP